jgi:hypothetical protein
MLGMAGLALLAGTAAAPAQAGEPFLASTGGKGFLAEEEQRLLNLRIQAETEARREIQAEREKLEEEGRRSQVGTLACRRLLNFTTMMTVWQCNEWPIAAATTAW